jgi:hypothetical protein
VPKTGITGLGRIQARSEGEPATGLRRRGDAIKSNDDLLLPYIDARIMPAATTN